VTKQSNIVEVFRKRVGVRLAILGVSVPELCTAHGDSGMRPYQWHRVLKSNNPYLRDYRRVADMLGVPLETLMFENGGLESLGAVAAPGVLESR